MRVEPSEEQKTTCLCWQRKASPHPPRLICALPSSLTPSVGARGTGGILVSEGRERRRRWLFALNLPAKLLKTSQVVNHRSLQSSSYLKWKKEKRPRKSLSRVAHSRSPARSNQPQRCDSAHARAAFLIEGANCRLTQLPGKALRDRKCQALHQQPNTSVHTALWWLRACEASETSAPPSNRRLLVSTG